MKRNFILPILSFIFLVVACASYLKRQECDKINWFDHGRKIALRGERVDADDMVMQCEKAEAEVNHSALDKGFKSGMETYCQPATVYQIGKRGELFNPDMCASTVHLQQKHKEGVLEYCQASNGYAAGTVGKPYNQICPKDLEKAFLPEFKRGRKTYLHSIVDQNESEVHDIDSEIAVLERRRANLQMELAMLGRATTMRREVRYDSSTHSQTEQVQIEDDPSAQSRRQAIMWDIDDVDRNLKNKRGSQLDLRKKIRELNTEIATL